ncbi:MAG TPA: nitroreductase [Thermomicrobiales bacterium]|nr:nitroreductase [Thermomicrobiales bacterium]
MTDLTTIGFTSLSTDNPVLAAIKERRSIGKVTTEVPPRELIWQLLEAGTWAPNHHLTEPWRFVVLEGDARVALGEVMGAVDAARHDDPQKGAEAADKTARKPLRAPYVIAVGVEPDPAAPEIEELCSGAAAAQNMLLAAEALGLAAIWRSGWIAFSPEIRHHLGFSASGRVLGFIYVGFAAGEKPIRTRRPPAQVTSWRER